MEMIDDIMLIHTSDKAFFRNGANHQSNEGFLVDTNTMTVINHSSPLGSASHSFNQLLKTDGDHPIVVDQGDGSPRSLRLLKLTRRYIGKDNSVLDFYNEGNGTAHLIEFPGGSGVNYTGVSVGSLAVSSTHYLVAGSSVYRKGITEEIFNSNFWTRDIFIASVDKNTMDKDSIALNWMTALPNKGESEKWATTPFLAKISDDEFIVLWSEGKKVKYMFVDDAGRSISDEYAFTGSLSDCVPIVNDGKVVWYTSKKGKDTFYAISIADPENVIIRTIG
jgi:hypothetical protein